MPVEAANDVDAFMFYCFYYGITNSTGSWGACSGLGIYAGLEVDSGVDPQSLEEFANTIIDLTIIGDVKDCANGQLSGCAWAAADLFGGKVVKWGSDLWSAMRKAEKACNSFIAGTLVLMADGTIKPIEDVEPGEKVLSANVTTGEVSAQVVSGIMTTPEQLRNLVVIRVDANGDGNSDGAVTATAGHAFWSTSPGKHPLNDDAKWSTASDLEQGAWLRDSPGSWKQVLDVQPLVESISSYNLAVKSLHTFFVHAGPMSILVHNQDVCGTTGNSLWELTRDGASKVMRGGPANTTFYKSESDGTWWTPDKAGHGGVAFKVYEETSKGLQWIADADIYGNYIDGKHKGDTGYFIKWNELKGIA